jgi:hypothetical protein
MRKAINVECLETAECPGYVVEQYRTAKGLYFRMFEKTTNGLLFVADWYKLGTENVKAS